MALFDNLDIVQFLGLVCTESTIEQVKETLCTKGILYKEYPDSFEKNKTVILFSYRLGNNVWDCSLIIKDKVLYYVSLNVYSEDSYNIFKNLCEELSVRYGSICEITTSQDKYEGTETITFTDKIDPFKFTEIRYDSSPIIGQKNVYINFFRYIKGLFEVFQIRVFLHL